ncbi:MAG: hypothetical protein JSR17_09505, partial [Proteobacteria bacterium]|nr:hypothetical protein [Pseudomonadota bacterium]
QFNLWRKAAEFRLMAWAYEMIHKAGGTYEPTKPKWTIPELVKNVRSGKFDPKTAQDFNDIFAVANAQWKSNLDQVDIWIKNI